MNTKPFISILIILGLISCVPQGYGSKVSSSEKTGSEPLEIRDTIDFCSIESDSILFDKQREFTIDEILLLNKDSKVEVDWANVKFISKHYTKMFGYTISPSELKDVVAEIVVWKLIRTNKKLCSFVLSLEEDFDGSQQYLFLFNTDSEGEVLSTYLLASKNIEAECTSQMSSIVMPSGSAKRVYKSQCYYESKTSYGSEETVITDSLIWDFNSQNERVLSSDTVITRIPIKE